MSDVFYDAFISYSTQDSDFVTALRLALEGGGRRVWQDVKELELTAEWWAQIKQGIAAADNFLFVVSPRSMASPICHLELEHARELRKRVIVIHYENADKTDSTRMMVDRILAQNYLKLLTTGRDMFGVADANWASIEAEQNISIANKDDLLTTVPRLVEAFDKDLLYIRQANILLGRAREWGESGNNASFLLVGEALKAAEAWRTAGKNPAPTADHIAYIEASRAAEDERLRQLGELEARREAAEQATERVQRKLRQEQRAGAVTSAFGGLVIGLAVMATVFALQLLSGVQGQVRVANGQLSAIPPTVAHLNALAVTAQAASDGASTEVANAGNALATATQALATGTQVAQQAAEQQVTLDAVNTQVVLINATVTQAAAVQEIVSEYGNTILQQSDNPEAQLKAMNALVARYSDYARAYEVRGLVLAQQQEYAQAIADFDQAIELDPANVFIYNSRGNSHKILGDYERAITDYDRAIALDPQYALAYNNRGNAYDDLADYQRAIADFDQAIALDPEYVEAYNNRGLAYANSKDYERAITDYTQAIALDPQYDKAYYNRGNAYSDLEDYQRAIADYDKALEHNPGYTIAYTNRGNVYTWLGDYERAIADYDQAIALAQDAIAYKNRGLVYMLLDDYERAVADFDAYKNLGGELEPELQDMVQQMERTLERQRARQTPTVIPTP